VSPITPDDSLHNPGLPSFEQFKEEFGALLLVFAGVQKNSQNLLVPGFFASLAKKCNGSKPAIPRQKPLKDSFSSCFP